MDNILVYVVGTAGSGKTTLTSALKSWMSAAGYDAVTLNLDPGAEYLPYSPDIDVRDWLSLPEVMRSYSIGPNAAQITCADMLALKISEIKKEVEKIRTNYIIVDTPGQIELFAFREASDVVVENLGEKAVILFLFDSILAKNVSTLISLLLLSATVQVRFSIPTVNVLSKADLMKEEELNELLSMTEDKYKFYDKISLEQNKFLSAEIFKALEDLGIFKKLIPTSSEELFGFEDIYDAIQEVYSGGEDLSKD
ncbi:MAG: ATP/GTP-binding protein [Candidatus Thermoplasmatota archaeon]